LLPDPHRPRRPSRPHPHDQRSRVDRPSPSTNIDRQPRWKNLTDPSNCGRVCVDLVGFGDTLTGKLKTRPSLPFEAGLGSGVLEHPVDGEAMVSAPRRPNSRNSPTDRPPLLRRAPGSAEPLALASSG